MFYCRTIIILLFVNFLSAYIPYTYRLPNNIQNYQREFEPGWPNPSIIDLGDAYQGRIFAATGNGPGMIDYMNFDTSVPTSDYLYKITDSIFDTQGNGAYDSNPTLRTFPTNNGGSLIVFSGVTEYIDDTGEYPKGTGIFWSLDNGETWDYIEQPIDIGNGDIVDDWYGTAFNHKSITTGVNNVTYDLSADVNQEYIYSTSWAGMLRRFKYTDVNPSWELIPLPMDGQDNLSCNLLCDNNNANCSSESYYYSPIDPPFGYYNHKPFSVHVEGDYIWVGTADGINRGEINSNGCINWEHYTMADGLGGNWVIGIHAQYFENITRIWAITWGANSSSSHYLSYTDDNGETWHKDNSLLTQGSNVVAYNIYSLNDINTASNEDRLYISTSEGLFKHYIYRGCMDIAADNFNAQANCPFASCLDECQYYLDITDGCNLEDNYFYLSHIGQNPTNNNEIYNLIYNSVSDVYSFEFVTSNGSIETSYGGDVDTYNFSTNISGQTLSGIALPNPIPSGSCGVFLTIEFPENTIPEFLYDIEVGVNNNQEDCYNYYTQDDQCLDTSNSWEEIIVPNITDTAEKVYSTLMDSNGHLWIGTTEGINVAYQEQNINTEEDSEVIQINSVDCMINDNCPDGLLIYPNPYFLSEGKYVNLILRSEFDGILSIYDFSGNKVIDKECTHGLSSTFINCTWDGYNKSNYKVSNGVYFCKIVTSDRKEYWQKLGVVNLR